MKFDPLRPALSRENPGYIAFQRAFARLDPDAPRLPTATVRPNRRPVFSRLIRWLLQ